jgi:hypothetical protein
MINHTIISVQFHDRVTPLMRKIKREYDSKNNNRFDRQADKWWTIFLLSIVISGGYWLLKWVGVIR